MIHNILDSDATLILYFGELEGGTEATLVQCIKKRPPYRLIDAAEITEEHAAEIVARFVARHGIKTLNVAGPSEHKAQQGHDYVRAVLGEALQYTGWRRPLE